VTKIISLAATVLPYLVALNTFAVLLLKLVMAAAHTCPVTYTVLYQCLWGKFTFQNLSGSPLQVLATEKCTSPPWHTGFPIPLSLGEKGEKVMS
jgi:hypothetical protein